MKKNSISRWIILCFLCILLLSLAISAAADYFEASQSAIRESGELAKVFSEIVSNLLEHHWKLDEPADSDAAASARRTLRSLCHCFGMDVVSVYTADPETPSRTYVLSAADDPEQDRLMEELTQKTIPVEELLEEEQELLDGSREMQRHDRPGVGVSWIAPFTDSNGELRALIRMDDDITRIRHTVIRNFVTDIIPFVLVLSAGMLVLLVLVRRRIVIPIGEISDRMKLFALDSRKKPEPLNIHSDDEIGEISASFEKMTEDISAYVNNIEKLTQEKTETETQMALARRIQYGLVPERTDTAGDGWRISAMTRPAKAVGGDFYDCFQRSDGSVCAVMGDVSGKGVSAAISMAMIRTVIREKMMAGLGPAETLNRTNDQFCAQNPENLFVTALAVMLNPETGELRYANAGHTRPVLLQEEPAFLNPDSGVVLGLFEDADLQEAVLTLAPGEGILLYTDGVTEAVNTERCFFGEKRLLEAVRGFDGGEDAAETVLRVSRAVGSFCGDCEPFDDMAVLALIRSPSSDAGGDTGPCAPASAEWKSLPVSLEAFHEVRAAVTALAGNSPETRRALLACDEALTNIVNYSGARHLSYSCACRDGLLKVSLSDDGAPFDPTAADIEEREFEMLDNGGMGLNLIRQTASSLSYERKDGRNQLTLYFSL